MSSISCDVLIIGSGPAGLSTAMHLVQRDRTWAERVLVLEKAHHPRPKLCGGGLTALGQQTLLRLDFPWPLPLPQTPVHHARFTYQRRTFTLHIPHIFIVFHRPQFDAYLAQEARRRGVRLEEGITVRRILPATKGWHIITDQGDYHAKVVVGADGSRGRTRNLGAAHRPSPTARVLEVITPTSDDTLARTATAIFDFSAAAQGLQGYIWAFPLSVEGHLHLNRGIYDARVARKAPKAPLPDLLQRAFPDAPHPQGHPIHLYTPFQPLARPGLLLVGDAAGADPLLGEGIGPALAYGKIAAEAIIAAFRGRDFRFRHYRRRILRSALGRYLTLRWAASAVAYPLARHALPMRALWSIVRMLIFYANHTAHQE